MRGKAVGYIRVGEENDDTTFRRVTRQIDRISDWAQDEGTDVTRWFFDLSAEATEPIHQRSAGMQLVERVSRGDVTHLVVASLDVLGKGPALLESVGTLFEAKQGLRIITVAPGPHEAAEPDEEEVEEAPAPPRLWSEATRFRRAA